MAKEKGSDGPRRVSRAGPSPEAISAFLADEGSRWLDIPNVVGVSVAEKRKAGRNTGKIAVRFDVVAKLDAAADIVAAGSRPIPEVIEIGGHHLPTDVVEGSPEPHPTEPASRRSRADPVRGGISVGSRVETGTLGTVLWHSASARPVALSNWHVLAGIGSDERTLQPGPLDGGSPARNALGRLAGAVLDPWVDAAITSIDGRGIDAEIVGLGREVTAAAPPGLEMPVIKSGRTSEVTHGVVKHLEKLVSFPFAGLPRRHKMTVCVIEPNPRRAGNGPLSGLGDSGSCWMLADENGRATGTMVGLHVAGDGPRVAYACHADQVFTKLGLEPLAGRARAARESAELVALAGQEEPGTPHRVIARAGLFLRSGPDVAFEPLDLLPHGETVHVIGSKGDWFMVDLIGDGKADGFVFKSFLVPSESI